MKYLYFSPLPQTSQPEETTTTGKQLSTLDAVDLDSTVVQAIGSQAADVSLDGQYRYGTKYATKFARELDELADSAFTNLPLFGDVDGEDISRPGYYAVEEAVVEPLHPNSHDVWTYDLSLTLEGTRSSHRQAVKTSKDSKDNDYGSNETTYISIPAKASLVEWWDGNAVTESASPVETRASAYGDLEVYDVDAAGVGDYPTLLYRPAEYALERDLHCRLWDTYGRDAKHSDEGIVHWVRAFNTGHDPRGELVLENGLLRLTLDDVDETITAERWDAGSSSWTSVSLGTSSWYPVDVDVRTIAPARLEARILWSDGSQRYPLDLVLSRGDVDALFARTPNAQSSTPSGLVDLLEPIAQTTIYDAGAEQALAAREEVSA